MFLHRGLAANVDVVGAVLGFFLMLLGPSSGSSWELLRASRASFAGLRVTESGSVAGSGAQPLLDKNKSNHTITGDNKNPPTHRWSSVLGLLNILPFASHMVTA